MAREKLGGAAGRMPDDRRTGHERCMERGVGSVIGGRNAAAPREIGHRALAVRVGAAASSVAHCG